MNTPSFPIILYTVLNAYSVINLSVFYYITCPTPPTDCTATYANNKLSIPCLSIALKPEVYQVDLAQQTFSFTFDVDLNSLKPQTGQTDACAATYSQTTGEAHVPCVKVNQTDIYDIYLLQQRGTLSFVLDGKRINKK